MFPVGIQIEIDAQYIDSDIEDLLTSRQILYQSEILRRTYRKKSPITLQEHLQNRVPGRNRQIQQISKYIQNVKKGQKSPMCLHGSTGCGKTSIITEMTKYLKQQNPQINTLYLNCLTFTSVKSIYSIILQQLFDEKDKKPQQMLSNLFSNPQPEKNSQLKLIIFDQVDQCFNNKTFVYNILQWVQISTVPFGIILISNMVDFATNIQSKSKSRIKFNSVIFAPYTYQNLIEIVKHKYSQWQDIIQKDAMIYLCKKIAGINSDVRLLQKYYKEVIDTYEKQSQVVTIGQIQKMFQVKNKGTQTILHSYYFILQIIWRSPKNKNIATDIQHYCLAKGIKKYKQAEVLYFLYQLQNMGVLQIKMYRKSSTYYFNNWGIDLKQYAYTIQATRNKN